MEIVRIFGAEIARETFDNLILLGWTAAFAGLGYIVGRVKGAA